MSYPEGTEVQNNTLPKQEEEKKNSKKILSEGSGSVELASFKNPKTWKKSISNFFRNQLRSSKSNDGDAASGSQENLDKDLTREQKWQSLGKIFRRHSLAEAWNASSHQQGESSSHSKRLAVRKVLSGYFGKNQKAQATSQSPETE